MEMFAPGCLLSQGLRALIRANLRAPDGQFYWPSVGTFVAAYRQYFMAADTWPRSELALRITGSSSYLADLHGPCATKNR